MTAYSSNDQFGECVETYFGLYPGVAKDVIDPENKGRITVELKWISDDYVTGFAPVAELYAGGGYGGYWIPEATDQVIVAFLHGRLSRPIVLGSLHSSVRLPHAARIRDGADPKYFRTKAGHMLLMEDSEGKRIELVDSTGNNSVLIDTEANSITVTAEADVAVEAGGNITLNASGDITISASGQITLTGSTINLN